MASFHQCNSCSKILLSSDQIMLKSHSMRCDSMETSVEGAKTKIEDVVKEKMQKTETLKRDEDTFQLITFLKLGIHLTRASLSSESSSSAKPRTGQAGVKGRPKGKTRKRERRPITDNSSEDEEKPNQGRIRYKQHNSSEAPLMRAYRFDCDQCPGRFYSKVEYNRHMNVHNGNRRLMKCIVCLRMFNKRDSLNHHYASHENAEEREEKLNLMHSWPKKTNNNRYARIRQACKYCLLVHTNQQSFVNHINTDHDGHSSFFSCGLDKCKEKFTKIRDLLQHAKEKHPLLLYGKFTLSRLNGVSVYKSGSKFKTVNPGKKVCSSKTVKAIKKSPLKKPKQQKKISLGMSHYRSDSEDEIYNFTERDGRAAVGSCEGFERTVELERVHIVDDENEENSYTVKEENTSFYSCYPDEMDPFLTTANQIQSNFSPSGARDDKDSYDCKDSIPIVLGFKTEPVI